MDQLNRVRVRITAFMAVIVIAAAIVASTAPQSVAAGSQPSTACVIHSLPSFIAQGEFALEGTVADIVEVECNPEVFPPGTTLEISDAQLFSRCPGGIK